MSGMRIRLVFLILFMAVKKGRPKREEEGCSCFAWLYVIRDLLTKEESVGRLMPHIGTTVGEPE